MASLSMSRRPTTAAVFRQQPWASSASIRNRSTRIYDYFAAISDADTILMCCPTCEYALGELGEKETSRTHGKRIMDVVVFLAEELQIKLDDKVALAGSSTVHLPCHYKPAKPQYCSPLSRIILTLSSCRSTIRAAAVSAEPSR